MISPTGLGIRGIDAWGSGEFGAPRGNHTHKGVDFICYPKQTIWFPFDVGRLVRIAQPYNKPDFLGCEIHAMDTESNSCGAGFYVCKMFYFLPTAIAITGKLWFRKGMMMGQAQDISKKYPGITPHVHLQVSHWRSKPEWFNPNNILEVQVEH